MSFLRLATLFAAITSLLALLSDLVTLFGARLHYLLEAGPTVWIGWFIHPLFLLALTLFFTVLFVKQKG